MKKEIHPDYQQITIKCACGNSFEVGSTSKDNIDVEICSNCHPFYTGKAKLIDTARRIDKFEARRKKAEEMKKSSKPKKEKKSSQEKSKDSNKVKK